MSDLACPATLIVVRHAAAEYLETWFSDEGGSLTPAGRTQAAELGQALASRRIAAVWSSDVSRAVQTAEIAAARLGVPVVVRKSLREVHVGSLLGQPFDLDALAAITRRWFDGELDARFDGGESGLEVVQRYGATLDEIADLHRGETVLVVAHQTAACITLPVRSVQVSPVYAEHHQLEHCQAAELLIDGDGWRLTRWGDRLL